MTRRPAWGLDRQGYRREVARLLGRIDELTRRHGALEAGGGPAGVLAALELEAVRTRRRLAAVIAARQAERSAPPARAAA